MHSEPIVHREEVTAILIVLGDINVNIRRIRELLEDGDGQEERQDDT